MPTREDILYTLQNDFAQRRLQRSLNQIIGLTDEKREFDWAWLGIQLCSGRWNGFLQITPGFNPALNQTVDLSDEILNQILLYANIFEIETYPGESCLYQYNTCAGLTAYFAPAKDLSNDEMIISIEFDNGVLTTVTNKQTFNTPINHNKLGGLQGGLSPDEYYHLNKAKYDEINEVPQVNASAIFVTDPTGAMSGISIEPVLSLYYNKGTDTITSHQLKRGNVIIPINAVDPSGTGTQVLTDIAITENTTYTYTVNLDGKPPIVITRTIVFALPIFYGATDTTVTPSEIIVSNQTQKTGNPLTINVSADDQYLFIAYPFEFGLLSSILNSFNQEQLPSWTQDGYPFVVTVTVGGVGHTYYLYRNNLQVSVTAFQLRFFFNS